ncbi:MAG: hypothetical protein ACRC80_35930 [Waterburya sp.]
MQGRTLSQWLDLLLSEYGLADVLDMLRILSSSETKLHNLTIKLEEAVTLATEAEINQVN